MRVPTSVKFHTVVSTKPSFIMLVRNFRGIFQKNFTGEKHAEFGPISNDFEVRRRISPKRIKIFKIGFLFRLLRLILRQAKQFRCSLVLPPNFYRRQRMTIFSSGDGGSSYNIFHRGVQNCLKMQRIKRKIFGVKGSQLYETLPRDVLLDGGDNPCTTFKGHRPLKIWECKKRAKFSTFNDKFRL